MKWHDVLRLARPVAVAALLAALREAGRLGAIIAAIAAASGLLAPAAVEPILSVWCSKPPQEPPLSP